MAQELSLILETPVEKLVPKMLAWNNQQLLAQVEEKLTHYENVQYDDSTIDVAKKDRAQLNTFAKALNDERIRIGKIYNTPYDKFKSEVDGVVNRVKEVSEKIGTQIQAYELKKQEEKQQAVIEYYKEAIAEFSGFIPYEKVHQPKWLNVSTSMKSIKADIDNIVTNARAAVTAIEALKSEDEEILKAFYFRTLNLSEALMENERLKQERAKIAELKAKQEQEIQTVVEPKVEEKPTEVKNNIQIVKFQVEGTIEQLKALQHFLRENNIKFAAIKEEK